MEILINELSLNGQFKDENEFFDSFDITLEMIKLIDILDFSLAKEDMFFNVAVTSKYKLSDFLRLRTDRAKRMKRFLAKLSQNPPYWNETQKHYTTDNYTFNDIDISNTSLAESCERDKIVLSFKHNNFLKNNLLIQKNSNDIEIYNITNKNNFLEYLLANNRIDLLIYCQSIFKDSNLNFSLLDDNYGFNILNPSQKKEFSSTLYKFSQMSWSNIIKSGGNKKGLKYKAYYGNWFKNTEYSKMNIFKFRTSQLYRCFGYREGDIFFVLRFEIDHKISDHG
ncbi:MAG: hypothetical protein QM493_11785 [Sulfurovum sp.]